PPLRRARRLDIVSRAFFGSVMTPPSEVNNSAAQRNRDDRRAILDVQLPEDVLDVHLHGLLAGPERDGDFRITHAFSDQADHLHFTWRQRLFALARIE